MASRNYVVRLWAPVSFRVRASSRKQAAARALKAAPTESGQMLHARVEEDAEARWLEASPWKLDADDFEGGVYLAQGSEVVNPEAE